MVCKRSGCQTVSEGPHCAPASVPNQTSAHGPSGPWWWSGPQRSHTEAYRPSGISAEALNWSLLPVCPSCRARPDVIVIHAFICNAFVRLAETVQQCILLVPLNCRCQVVSPIHGQWTSVWLIQ